tara:strand:- start:1717 stop:2085 length:369 start_codon:yes stop_codon:yes gene_type:complete
MAKELKTGSASMTFDDGDTRVRMSKAGLEIDTAGKQHIHTTQNIGTSPEALDLGDLTTLGWAFFFNQDKTNYVEIRPATGVADFLRIEKREWSGPMRLAPEAVPFAIADTDSVKLEYLIIED